MKYIHHIQIDDFRPVAPGLVIERDGKKLVGLLLKLGFRVKPRLFVEDYENAVVFAPGFSYVAFSVVFVGGRRSWRCYRGCDSVTEGLTLDTDKTVRYMRFRQSSPESSSPSVTP